MEVRHEEYDAIIELFEASMKGCVITLKILIEKHPLILNEISLISFGETPLHISALFGHLDFTKTLLDRKPQLAMELDSLKRLPLHLASAEGHTEIVKALLNANKNANFVRDQVGRIPLHYAAMRGRVDVVRELISTTGVALVLVLDGGKSSVLHLCVKNKHLKVLKELLDDQSVRDNEVFLNLQDGESGNTILQLAVMQKKIKTIKHLLSIPKVKARPDEVKRALEILKQCPKDDFKSFRIRNILMDAHADAEREQNQKNQKTRESAEKPKSFLRSWCEKIMRWLGSLRYDGNWVKNTRGFLMVVATMITSMTFQASLAPPGGIWGLECKNNKNSTFACDVGTSVLAQKLPVLYFDFVVFNTIAFVASLSVVFLLISGFPLKSKVVTWILTFAMFTSLTFTALAYLYAMIMLIPDPLFSDLVYTVVIYIWVGLAALVLGIHSVRLLALLVKKRHYILNHLKKARASSTNRDGPKNGIEDHDQIEIKSSVR